MQNRAFAAVVFLCSSLLPAYAQYFLKPASEPVPVASPDQLLQQLTLKPSVRGGNNNSQSEKQATTLAALGIDAQYDDEARLLYEDLDGDGVPEALLTVDIDGANVILVVLKRKGNQWYRLPPQQEFSCWCKYETEPLDSFVEVEHWGYSFEDGIRPKRLILVRGSGGGTGLYERTLDIFALDGFQTRRVFETTEERRIFPWPEKNAKAEEDHVIVTLKTREEPRMRTLLAQKIHLSIEPDKARSDGEWWVGLPVASCVAYRWENNKFKFVESADATTKYCRPVKRTATASSANYR